MESFVKCVKNSIDEINNVRSICLNFEIKVDGKLIGKGNNLNLNNLSEEDYATLCNAFGLNSIDDATPFVTVMYTARQKEKVEAWMTSRARSEKEIPETQASITEDPETEISEKKKQKKKKR